MTAKSSTGQSYSERHKTVLDSILLGFNGVRAGKMFGYPSYYVLNKLFACVYREGIGIKVPEDLATELLKKRHIVPFQPLGKSKMREWIQINRKRSEDYKKDITLFQASIAFVKGQSKRG